MKIGICENYHKINWKKAFEIAKKNTKYNSQGQAVITKDDEWRYETEWDEYAKVLHHSKTYEDVF